MLAPGRGGYKGYSILNVDDFLRPSSPADFRLTLTLSYRPLLISLPLALIYPFLSDTAPRQSIYLDTLHQIWTGIEKTVEPPT